MSHTSLSSYDNNWYEKQIGASVWKRGCWYLISACFYSNRWFPFSSVKVAGLRLFGAEIGKHVVIKPHVNIKFPWKLNIGDYSWIGEDVWIDNLAPISVGPNVCISQGAMLLTGNHNYKKSTFNLTVDPITIEDGAWVGAKSIVCPGVTIRSHAVLAVGSVATQSLEAYKIYQGNPAVEVRTRVIE